MTRGLKILIIGASGFLGTKLMQSYSTIPNSELFGTTKSAKPGRYNLVELDITNRDQVAELVKNLKPDLIINAAGIANAKVCEEDEELAKAANALGAENIAYAAADIGAKLVHISTSAVFGQEGQHNEYSIPDPSNAYGRSKHEGEVRVNNICEESIILRQDMLYGFNGLTLPNGLIDKIIHSSDSEIGINNDQMRQPVWVDDITRIIQELYQKDQKGIFHIAPHLAELTTRFEIAKRLEVKLGRAGEKSSIIPVTADKEVAARPKGLLDASRLHSLGLRLTPFHESLRRLENQYSGDSVEGQRRNPESEGLKF